MVNTYQAIKKDVENNLLVELYDFMSECTELRKDKMDKIKQKREFIAKVKERVYKCQIY